VKNRRRTACIITETLERRRLLAVGPVGPEFKVNTFTTNAQINSAVAMDATGNFVVVWQSSGADGAGDGIRGQRYSSGGAPQGEEFAINEYTTSNQQLPSVAMDADGDFVVAWQSNGQDGNGNEIWARRFAATGAPAAGEFHVNTTTTSAQLAPAVAMDDAGNFVIAWHSQNGTVASYDIYAARYSAAGSVLQSEFAVNVYTTASQANASVAMDTDGDFVIAWQSFGQDSTLNAVVALRFNQSGAPQGEEILVNEVTTGSQRVPSVGMDSVGNFVITWESDLQDGSNYGIYARRYSAAGTALAGEFKVNTTTTDQQRVPQVAVDVDGDFVITWASRPQDGSLYGIYAQAYLATGAADGPEFKVNTTTANSQFAPAIAMDSEGDFVITWQSDLQDGSGFGIYAQRYGQGSVLPPEVLEATFIYQDAPQRIVYRFNTDVSLSLTTTDLVLENLSTMTTIQPTDLAVAYDGITNTATFTFNISSLSWLPDGNYRATLLAAGVTNSIGTPLPADNTFNFYFLQGDANHDARVSLADFNILAGNFGFSARDFTQGNFNYDAAGLVTLQDFNLLASRFGVMLAPAARTTSALSDRRDAFTRQPAKDTSELY
jgi:hypothetical protein